MLSRAYVFLQMPPDPVFALDECRRSAVRLIAVSTDGSTLACWAEKQPSISIWDIESKSLSIVSIKTFSPHLFKQLNLHNGRLKRRDTRKLVLFKLVIRQLGPTVDRISH